jgi:glycosyltransferase involved in cell wall biosynthesis
MERLTFARHAWKDLAAGGYDYIYVRKPYDLPWALLAARRCGARVVYGSGGTEFFPGYRFLVKRVDIFTACSRYNADEIEAYTGLRPRVLYNGVDVDLFRPQPPDVELGRSLGLAEGVPVLVTACRLIGWKGVDDAIRAVGVLKDQGLKVRHLVLGDGEVRAVLERLAQDLGLEGSVAFLGRVNHEELPRFYSLAALAVFSPVGAETFGISIAEAMACGVPVVATKVGGIPEVVGEESGFLVPARDVAGLARALAELLKDKNLRARLARSARCRVEERFTWAGTARRFEELRAQAERAAEAS